jgi:pyruvate kinase
MEEDSASSPRKFVDNRSRKIFNNSLPGTKILCTLGPASSEEKVLEKMMFVFYFSQQRLSGMDAVRFNFSHGSHEFHTNNFDLVRNLSKKLSLNIAILCDIQGPKIRVGEMEYSIELVRKQKIRVTYENGKLNFP